MESCADWPLVWLAAGDATAAVIKFEIVRIAA